MRRPAKPGRGERERVTINVPVESRPLPHTEDAHVGAHANPNVKQTLDEQKNAKKAASPN